MALPSFPELSRAPLVSIEETPEDKTLRDGEMENGAVFTRTRPGRCRRTFVVNYGNLTEDDYRALQSFFGEDIGFGAGTFLWKDPRLNDRPQYAVRLTKPWKISDDKPAGGVKRFKLQMEIQEK